MCINPQLNPITRNMFKLSNIINHVPRHHATYPKLPPLLQNHKLNHNTHMLHQSCLTSRT